MIYNYYQETLSLIWVSCFTHSILITSSDLLRLTVVRHSRHDRASYKARVTISVYVNLMTSYVTVYST